MKPGTWTVLPFCRHGDGGRTPAYKRDQGEAGPLFSIAQRRQTRAQFDRWFAAMKYRRRFDGDWQRIRNKAVRP